MFILPQLFLLDTVQSAASCQSNMEEGEMETSRHFLFYCPAFARLWLKNFSSLTIGEPENIAETDISQLKKCVIDSKRFVGL